MKVVIVIPARYHSTRLPGKPLIDLNGKSMLQRTYNQCVKAINSNSIFVATDHKKIKKHCIKNKMNCILTSNKCLTGTDRVVEFSKKIDADIYINVQGDEPLINPNDIVKLIDFSKKHPNYIINGYTPISKEEDFKNINIPKVVLKENNDLLYISRSAIPGNKNEKFIKAWRQVCIYAFPKSSLEIFSLKNIKTKIEKIEDIEILRFLELGYNVKMLLLSNNSISVDTEEDVEKIKKIIIQVE